MSSNKPINRPKSPSIIFSNIAETWDFEKNINLHPSDVTLGSNLKVWWKCPSCGESWEAKISSRTGRNKTGCPYCAGKKISKNNNFAAKFPDIAKEWDRKKNIGIRVVSICM